MTLDEPLIYRADIDARVDELCRGGWLGEQAILMPVMVGALPFVADMMRAVAESRSPLDIRGVIPVYASSYHGTQQADHVTVALPSNAGMIVGEDVVIIEDIVDTGRTIAQVHDAILNYNPNSIRVVTMLDKPSRREIEVGVDWVGFEVPDTFVVGYGLDLDGRYRALLDVWTLKEAEDHS